jgi:hypothetical protein
MTTPITPDTAVADLSSPPTNPTRSQSLLNAFQGFRAELDAHQQQRERVIVASRQVTQISKKQIFALHRLGTGASKQQVFKEAEKKMDELRVQFALVQKEVQGSDFWRCVSSLSSFFRRRNALFVS